MDIPFLDYKKTFTNDHVNKLQYVGNQLVVLVSNIPNCVKERTYCEKALHFFQVQKDVSI